MNSVLSRLVPLAWPLLVLATGWHWRPRRVPVLDRAAHEGAAPLAVARPFGAPPFRARRPPVDLLVALMEGVGRALRRAARRPVDRSADRVVGLAVLATAFLAPVSPPLALLVAPAWWVVPWARRRRASRAADAAVRRELPLVADLFVLAAGAGLTVPLAVASVARHSRGPLAAALMAAERRTQLGQHPADALEALVGEAGEAVRPLVSVLTSAERYGTPLVGPLERVAEDVRRQRRRHAEEAARRVPVKLLFPLVLCTLPAFALLTVVPLLISVLGGLRA